MKLVEEKTSPPVLHSPSGQVQSLTPELEAAIDRVFEAQMAHHWKMRRTTADERIQRLKAILNWIENHRTDIHEALYRDLRKPAPEVDLSEIFVVTSEIKHAIRHLPRWMKPRRVARTLALATTSGYVRYEPRGVSLIISPWNFPFNLSVGPLVSAIAAGNCVILKPSEFSPHTSLLVREMVEALFPAEEVAVFLGDASVARALLKKPFHHIFFTGSTRVGREVMKAAAQHLASVTLELGGKSPVIVDESANLKDAARKIVWGKFLNSGQTCIAPDYLLVQKDIYQPFLALLRAEVERVYGTSPEARQQCPDYARIIHPAHWQRLQQALQQALTEGAQLEMGGHWDQEERFIEPTIVSQVPARSTLLEEEIFGPILPIIPFATLDEAVQIINEKDPPLAIYLFSSRKKAAEQILHATRSGTVCVNEVLLQFMHLNLPFGGVNASGLGSAHGFYGFKAFSHERAVLKHHARSPLKILYPPYTPLVQRIIKLVLKYL